MEGHLWPEVMDGGIVMGQVERICPLMIFLSIPQWNMSLSAEHWWYIPFSLSFSRLCGSFFFKWCSRSLFDMQTTHMQSQAEWRGHVFGRTSSVRMWHSESLQQKQQLSLSLSSARDVGVRLHYYLLWARPPHFIDTSCLPEPSKALFLKQTAEFQVPHWLFSLFCWIHLGLRYIGKTGLSKAHWKEDYFLHFMSAVLCVKD